MATNNTSWLNEALAEAVKQVSGPFQANTVAASTQAVLAGAGASSGGGPALGTIGDIASQVLGSGLGITSLIGGLVRLFGGGGESAPAPLMEYTLPESLSFEGRVSRAADTTEWVATQGFRTGTPMPAPAQQITVQVNAMDSKSFLDHSDDIARAVRQAMLNSHSLNDVVNDL
ncbi:MAG: hypothetical protein ACM336_18845 [Acidobacteriota bacterium]